MRLIPFYKYELKTSINQDEVIRILNTNIDTDFKSEIFSSDHLLGRRFYKKYRGSVNQENFKMTRIPQWGVNGFIPVTIGDIINTNNGCKIKIRIRFHTLLNLLLLFPIFLSILTFVFESQTTDSDLVVQQLYEDKDTQGVMREVLSEDEFKTFDYKSYSFIGSKEFIITYIFFYILIITLYNYESKIIKSDLREILIERKNVC
jgi:hypothetical protein